MRVQRTRSSASPPRSPLTRWPLGGWNVMPALVLMSTVLGCASTGVDPRVDTFPDLDAPCADRVDARPAHVSKPRGLDSRYAGKFVVVGGYVREDGTVAELRPVGGNDPSLLERVMAAARTIQLPPYKRQAVGKFVVFCCFHSQFRVLSVHGLFQPSIAHLSQRVDYHPQFIRCE